MLQPSANHSSTAGYQTVAKDYDKGRPDYPQKAITTFATALGIQTNTIVLDLAAGTGKLTKALLATKARIIAVEPVAGMRDIFSVQFPKISILAGSAEALPLQS